MASSAHEVPKFKVTVNGTELKEAVVADLTQVSVLEDVEAPGMFTLELLNWDTTKAEVTWSDDKLFQEGGKVAIQMGYGNKLTKLTEGEITSIEPEFSTYEAPTLLVRGFDVSHRLARGRNTRSFVKMSDSDIAKKIAGEAKVPIKATATSIKFDYVLQHNQTDRDFLQDRAWRIGYEMPVIDGKLNFRPRDNKKKEVLTLTRSMDLLCFSARLSTSGQWKEASVTGWDVKTKKAVTGKAASSLVTAKLGGKTTGLDAAAKAFGKSAATSVDRPVLTKAEADDIAKGRLNEMALAYVVGEGTCIGNTKLRAGTVIKLDGVGTRFGGQYYVTSCTHTYRSQEGYRTSFSVRRTAT